MRGADFTYDLAFEPVAEAEPDDVIVDNGGLAVVVPADSVDDLRGATLDLPRHSDQGGLVLRNPNRPQTPQLGEAIELTGTPEEKVRQLLNEQVNPAIAMHGGFTELVKVEDDKAFITMGGGCQGCAMSAMTLRQGIETAILSDRSRDHRGGRPHRSRVGREPLLLISYVDPRLIAPTGGDAGEGPGRRHQPAARASS